MVVWRACSGLLIDVSHSELVPKRVAAEPPCGGPPYEHPKTARVDEGLFGSRPVPELPERVPPDHHTRHATPRPTEQPNTARVGSAVRIRDQAASPDSFRNPRVQESMPASRPADRAWGYINPRKRKWDVVQPVEPATRGARSEPGTWVTKWTRHMGDTLGARPTPKCASTIQPPQLRADRCLRLRPPQADRVPGDVTDHAPRPPHSAQGLRLSDVI
jgi:hypothetical protein